MGGCIETRYVFRTLIELAMRTWVVGAVAALAGVIYSVLIYSFTDAMEAADEFSAYTGEGGPYTLFLITSFLLGWCSVGVLERILGVTGGGLWLIALPWWVASICGGFVSASLIVEHVPDSVLELAVLCAVTVACTGALRIGLSQLL